MTETTAPPPEHLFLELQNAAFAALAARTRPGLAPIDDNPHTPDIDIADLADLFAPAAGRRVTFPEYGTVKLLAYRLAYVLHFTDKAALARWIACELRRLGAEADVVGYFEQVATERETVTDPGLADVNVTAFRPFTIDPDRIAEFATATVPSAHPDSDLIHALLPQPSDTATAAAVDVRFHNGMAAIHFDSTATHNGDAAPEGR